MKAVATWVAISGLILLTIVLSACATPAPPPVVAKPPIYACFPAQHRATQQPVLLCHPVEDDRK